MLRKIDDREKQYGVYNLKYLTIKHIFSSKNHDLNL